MLRFTCLVLISFVSAAARADTAFPFELVVQDGHGESRQAAFSPDGELVATAGDRSIKIWTRDGRLLRNLPMRRQAMAVAFSPDGKSLASASDQGELLLWTREGRLIRELPNMGELSVPALSFGSDSETLIAINGRITRVTRLDGTVAATYHDSTDAIALGRDGRALASSGGSSVVVRDASGTQVAEFSLGDAGARRLALSADGSRIYAVVDPPGREKRSLVIFSQSGKKLGRAAARDPIEVAFSPATRRLAWMEWEAGERNEKTNAPSLRVEVVLAGADGKVERRTSVTHLVIDRAEAVASLGGGALPTHLAFRSDGKALAFSVLGRTFLMDAEGGSPRRFGAATTAVTELAVSPAGDQFATGHEDGSVAVWSRDGKLLYRAAGEKMISGLAFSRDGNLLASSSFDKFLTIRNRAGQIVARDEVGDSLRSLSFSADGKLLFGTNIAVSTSVPRVFLISTADAHTINLWGEYTTGAFTNDGSQLLIGSCSLSACGRAEKGRHQLKLSSLDARKATELTDLAGGNMIVDPAGRYFASIISARQVNLEVTAKKMVIARTDGTVLRTIDPSPAAAAFSPDGKLLALAQPGAIAIGPVADGPLTTFPADRGGYVHEFEFSPDGRYLKLKTEADASDAERRAGGGGPDGTRIWSVGDKLVQLYGKGAPKEAAAVFSSPLTTVAFSADSKLLLSWTAGGLVLEARSIETGEVVNLLAVGSEWAAYSPDGYYDSSLNGGRYLGMSAGMESYAIDQFAVRNNRPDLLLKRLGVVDPDAIEFYRQLFLKRLRKAGLTEEQLSNEVHVPTALIQSSKQEKDSLKLSLAFADSKYQLTHYNIYVNDVPLFAAAGKKISGQSASAQERVQLTAGENRIEVSCSNDKGVESFRTALMARSASKDRGDLHVIAFGVSAYRDPQLKLEYAHKDARDLSRLFARMKGKEFNHVNIATFTDDQVTPTAIKAAKALLAKAKPADTLVLFIAGHGLHDRDSDSTYYYLTHDAELANLPGTAANFDDIEDLLQGIAPRRKLFLMDTCESGEADEGSAKPALRAQAGGVSARGIKLKTTASAPAVNATPKRLFLRERDRFIYNDVTRRSGAIVFSSSRGGEYSYERADLKNGVFTHKLLDALTSNEADADKNGRVSIDELRRFVSKAVSLETNGLQNPTVDRDNLFQKFELPIVGR